MTLILFAFIAVIAGGALTALAIAWARAARMQDEPGARRMHAEPTVRGAGIGFVATIVAGWGGLGWAIGWQHPLGRWALCSTAALGLVAVVSWIDDRRNLPVLPRLAAHFGGGALLLLGSGPSLAAHGLTWALPLVLLGVAAAINFWNFMDGIDGMAAMLAFITSAGFAAFAAAGGDVPAAWFGAITAGAVLGFLPSNFPSARAFMGDVGSASLGMVIAALALQPRQDAAPPLAAGLLLAAPALLDAGLTLLWRVARRPRRRWYTAHREHLYQWLARSGWSHARTTLAYSACGAGIATLVLLIGPERPQTMLIAVPVVYLAGTLAWRLARDAALARVRSRT